MEVMNPINEIFIKTMRLHEAKWYQFIRKYKLNREISDIKYYLLNELNIFSFSDEFYSVYCSLPNAVRHKYRGKFIIGSSHIAITCIDKYNVIYSPKEKAFSITATGYGTFTIRKDTGVASSIRMGKWKELQDELKMFYIDTIIDSAETLVEYNKGD